MAMTSPLWRSLVASFLVTTGCQSILGIEPLGSRPDGGPGASIDAAGPAVPDASTPDFSFAVLTTNPTLPLDGTDVIELEIQRTGGFTGEVTVGPMSLPGGLVVEEVTVAGDQTRAQIPVGARAPLGIGDTISFDLVATASAELSRTRTVNDATVTGKPGLLDVSFGADATGYAAISFGNDDSGSFFDLDVTGDGKILAAGWGVGGLGAIRVALARLTDEGQLDPDFNGGALVRADFGSGSTSENAQAYAVGRQVDGRIITIGWHSANMLSADIALVRYRVGGGIDGSEFGNYANGKSRIDLAGTETVADGLVLPDSKILAAGERGGRLVLARATTAGDLDTTFASPNGYQTITIGTRSAAEAITLDAQGRILVAGFVDSNGQRDMIVLRYTQDGAPDTTFGDQGTVILGDAARNERAAAIAVRPDGRIVVAGESNGAGSVDFELQQLLPDGRLDPDFGQMGVSRPPITAQDVVAEDMLVLPQGRILVAGNMQRPGGSPDGPVLARYTRDGALDPHFDGDGVLELFLGENGVARGLAAYGNSKVLVSGGNQGGTPGPGTFGVVVRMWM